MKIEMDQALPHAREEDLLVREFGDETLVYDLNRHMAYCLNRTSVLVWRQCDGQSGLAEITSALQSEAVVGLDEEVVRLALKQLKRAHLIDGTIGTEAGSRGMSRRELMKRAGIAA